MPNLTCLKFDHSWGMPEAVVSRYIQPLTFCSIYCQHEKVENIIHFLCTCFLFLPELQKLFACEMCVWRYDTSMFPQTAREQSSYFIVNICENDIMVHIETRPRQSISFVRHRWMGQRPNGDVNPGLFQTTHFICILKGGEVENETGNGKK